MKYLLLRTLWPEKKGMWLHRDDIGEQVIFLHLLTPIKAILKGVETPILPGGCVFFGIHSMQHFSSFDCPLLHDWFHADKSCVDLMEKYGLECETVYYPCNSDEITRLMNLIDLEMISYAKYSQEKIDALSESLFIEIARSTSESSTDATNNFNHREAFIQLRSKIHMQINKDWTIEGMAEQVKLSPSWFSYLYKVFFGISPHDDLIKKRVQAVQVLLERGDSSSLEQIAERCGYKNQYHLIRQFKQITGITPGKYRQNHTK